MTSKMNFPWLDRNHKNLDASLRRKTDVRSILLPPKGTCVRRQAGLYQGWKHWKALSDASNTASFPFDGLVSGVADGTGSQSTMNFGTECQSVRTEGRRQAVYQYQFCMTPTRPRKVEAAATAPSATFRPSGGSGSVAGPTITSAAFLGLKREPWQEQTNAARSLDHMLTGQPWCVQMAE